MLVELFGGENYRQLPLRNDICIYEYCKRKENHIFENLSLIPGANRRSKINFPSYVRICMLCLKF